MQLSRRSGKPIGFLDVRRHYTQTLDHGKPIGTMLAMTTEDTRIAALAAEQFQEHGITATGVEALSRAAGISKRTLYQRFGSKEGLIVAAYEALDAAGLRNVHGGSRGADRRSARPARGLLRAARAARSVAALPRLSVRQCLRGARRSRPSCAHGRSPPQGADPRGCEAGRGRPAPKTRSACRVS